MTNLLPTCRFNLHLQWNSTVFVLNLAFADLLYCAIHLPVYALNYFHHTWDWGFLLCYISASFRYITSYAEWMGIALVAISRYVLVTRNKYLNNIHVTKYQILLILSNWIYATILLLPTFFQVRLQRHILSTAF